MGIKVLVLLSALVASTASASRSDWPSLIQRLRREVVDLHSGEFCVDVSTFKDVEFVTETVDKCTSTFQKRCEDKTEQKCEEVTEIQCEVVPYTECQMTMEATPYQSFEMTQLEFTKKVCREEMGVQTHTKMMPECKNVTKQNCITKWETDENGNQVWAGNEACEPVTWRECRLVPREVEFKIPKVICEDGETVPYQGCEDVEKSEMTTKMTCEVKSSTNCKPVTSTKCGSVTYQECFDEPIEECKPIDLQVPMQEKEHKKKCLLPDDGTQNFGTPRGAKSLGNLVAQVKAQEIADQVNPDESRRSFARPLPLTQNFHQRQGRVFQGHRNGVHKQNRRFQTKPLPQTQGHFVRGN